MVVIDGKCSQKTSCTSALMVVGDQREREKEIELLVTVVGTVKDSGRLEE